MNSKELAFWILFMCLVAVLWDTIEKAPCVISGGWYHNGECKR